MEFESSQIKHFHLLLINALEGNITKSKVFTTRHSQCPGYGPKLPGTHTHTHTHRNPEKCDPYIIEINTECFKTAILTVLKDIKENIPVMNVQMGNLSGEIKTIKENQIKILELKNTRSEIKI